MEVAEEDKRRNDYVFYMEDVTKSFGGLMALSEVSLGVNEGEIIGIIGPNGAGKSTLFNVITSIYRPDAGGIYLKGREITGMPSYKVCHVGIARTFQLVKTFLGMKVFENALIGAIYGNKLGGKQAREKAILSLELVGLAEKCDILTSHLNLSDRRLLEVARALASNPLLLLLDEPMAGLNPTEIKKMMKFIDRLKRERNISVLWVEHKIEAVFGLCDKIVVLDYGKKIAEGYPHEIAKNPLVIEAYLGKSPTCC